MPREVGVDERRARLARRHLLLPESRTDDVAAVADSVVALHSSDPVSVHLSAAMRMAWPSVRAVEHALYDDRSLLRLHGMRRTLWVVRRDLAAVVDAAVTRRLVGPERRRLLRLLADNGVGDPETWLSEAGDQALAALHEHGPMTARQLGAVLPALTHKLLLGAGTRYEVAASAHTRVLLLLGFEGRILRTRPMGSWVSGAYAYAPADAWVPGGLADLGEREAAGELALRWLRAFGPGTEADLRWWTGWTAATTRRALADARAVPVTLKGAPGWVAPGDEQPVAPVGPWVALLPGLDPTTMGWRQRDWYLPPGAAAAFDRNGNAGPTVWVDGRVAGVWAQTPDGDIRTRLFEDLPRSRRREVDRRAAELAATVGTTRFTVRFPSPLSAALAGGAAPGDGQ